MTTKGKTPKCKHCGEWVDKSLNDFIKKSVGYYHNECNTKLEIQQQHRKELLEYISKAYRIEFPTGYMLKQIKEFHEKRNYTYKGMEYTLRFMFEVEHKHTKDASSTGLGLIPFYYEKAKQYYTSLSEVRDSVENINLNQVTEVIYLTPSETKKKRKFIDISSI